MANLKTDKILNISLVNESEPLKPVEADKMDVDIGLRPETSIAKEDTVTSESKEKKKRRKRKSETKPPTDGEIVKEAAEEPKTADTQVNGEDKKKKRKSESQPEADGAEKKKRKKKAS